VKHLTTATHAARTRRAARRVVRVRYVAVEVYSRDRSNEQRDVRWRLAFEWLHARGSRVSSVVLVITPPSLARRLSAIAFLSHSRGKPWLLLTAPTPQVPSHFPTFAQLNSHQPTTKPSSHPQEMRVTASLAAFCSVLAALELPAARAGLCSIDEMDTINSIDDASSAPSDCFVVTLLSSSDWSAEVCEEHAECIPYLASLVDQLPDCSYLGVDVRGSIEDAVANCQGSTGTDGSGSANATDSITTDASSSSGSSSSGTASADTGDNAASRTFSLACTVGLVITAQLVMTAM
jgi:hypothetical protein